MNEQDSSSSTFDAHVIAEVHGRMDWPTTLEHSRCVVIQPLSGRIQPVPGGLLAAIPAFQEMFGQEFPLERTLTRTIPQDLAEMISKRRVKFTLLLDSIGGSASVQQHLTALMLQIRKSHGEVVTFIGTSAMSAAALLLPLSDRNYAPHNARIMFHPGSFVNRETADRIAGRDVASNFAEQMTQRGIQEIRFILSRFVLNPHDQPAVERFEAALSDQANPDSHVNFAPEELPGLIHYVGDEFDLADKFTTETTRPVDFDAMPQHVAAAFFFRAARRAELRQRMEISWQRDPDSVIQFCNAIEQQHPWMRRWLLEERFLNGEDAALGELQKLLSQRSAQSVE